MKESAPCDEVALEEELESEEEEEEARVTTRILLPRAASPLQPVALTLRPPMLSFSGLLGPLGGPWQP